MTALRTAADHLVEALAPLGEALASPGGFRALMGRLGWNVRIVPPEWSRLADDLAATRAAVDALADDPELLDVLAVADGIALAAGAIDVALAGALTFGPVTIRDPHVGLVPGDVVAAESMPSGIRIGDGAVALGPVARAPVDPVTVVDDPLAPPAVPPPRTVMTPVLLGFARPPRAAVPPPAVIVRAARYAPPPARRRSRRCASAPAACARRCRSSMSPSSRRSRRRGLDTPGAGALHDGSLVSFTTRASGGIGRRASLRG